MWKVGPHELFDHTGPSLRRVTFEISGHFSGVRCIDGLSGILITPNCVRFRPEADIRGMARVCSVIYTATFPWRYDQSSLPLSIIKI